MTIINIDYDIIDIDVFDIQKYLMKKNREWYKIMFRLIKKQNNIR